MKYILDGVELDRDTLTRYAAMCGCKEEFEADSYYYQMPMFLKGILSYAYQTDNVIALVKLYKSLRYNIKGEICNKQKTRKLWFFCLAGSGQSLNSVYCRYAYPV